MHWQGRGAKRSNNFSEGLSAHSPFQEAETPRAAEEASLGNEERPATENQQADTDDIVRLYLKDMGKLPRLSRAEEIALGRRKDSAQAAGQRVLTASHYVATQLASLIESIQRQECRLDTLIDGATSNSKRKEGIRPLLDLHGLTIRTILARNEILFAQKLRRTSPTDKAPAQELARGRLKITRLVSEIRFRERVFAELKDELKLFALETSLLKSRLQLATLKAGVAQAASPQDPSSKHDESIGMQHQRLTLKRESIQAEIVKHTGVEESQCIVRTREELFALHAIVRRLERDQGEAPSNQLVVTRLKAIISNEHALSTAMSKLATLEQSKQQYDSFEEFERARTSQRSLVNTLIVEKRLLQQQRNNTSMPEEVSAMKWALRERLRALGESPKAALQRIARHEYYAQEFTAAVNDFVRGNLRLVVSIAKKKLGLGVDFPDLIQHGNEGLVKAAKKFDYSLGFTFGTYATWWIRQGISRAIAEQSSTIRLPIDVRNAVQELKMFDQSLMLQLGRNPTEEERLIAYAEHKTAAVLSSLHEAAREKLLKKYHNELQILSRIGGVVFSLNYSATAHQDSDLLGLLPSSATDVGSSITHSELRDVLFTIMEVLNPRERRVILERYGLGSTPIKQTLNSLREALGVTRERVRQIQKQAEEKMHQNSKRRNLSID